MTQRISRRAALGGSFAAALAVGAVASTAAPALATPVSSFKDVPTSHVFHKEITALAKAGVIGGWSDGTFRPNATVRRDAMAAFLYRLVGQPKVDLSMGGLVDVPTGTHHREAMYWAWQQGVIYASSWSGAKQEFEPTRPMTRIQGLVAIARLHDSVLNVERGQFGMAAPAFDDMPLSQYPELSTNSNAATWGRTRGITEGWTQGTKTVFRPEDPLLRDAAAAFVYRLGVQAPNWSERFRIPLPQGFVRL